MSSTRSDWRIPAALIALSMVPAVAGTVRLAQLAGGTNITPENARFFASPLPVVLHIPTVMVYSILGAFQFSPSFRRRRRGWHRAAGRILVPCGLVAALSGLWMAQFYPWPAGDGQLVYLERLVFGSAMVVSIVLALDAIRRRDFASHGAWMIRAYAIGLGAGTQVLTHLPWFILVGGKPGELPRALMMGAGWAINVVVAEWIIRKRHVRPSTVLATVESRIIVIGNDPLDPTDDHRCCASRPVLGTSPGNCRQRTGGTLIAEHHSRMVARVDPGGFARATGAS